MRVLRINPVICSFVVLFVILAADGHSTSLRQIRSMYKRKDYGKARLALRDEITRLKGKSYREGLLLLASLETRMESAVTVYAEVVSTGGTREAFRARLELGKLYYSIGEYGKALEFLLYEPKEASSRDRMEAAYFRALSWKQLGENGRAWKDLDAIDRGEFLNWSYMTRAELDMQEGRIEDAINRYETIAGSHSNPIAGFKLGECYEIMGERQKALKVYRTLLHQFPLSLEAPKAREKIQVITHMRRERRTDNVRGGGEVGEATGEDLEAGDDGIPIFTLQLGAFSERANAIRMADDLRGIMEEIRVERVEIDGRIWHRVRVGRYTDREEAEEEATRIKKRTGYSCKILPLG